LKYYLPLPPLRLLPPLLLPRLLPPDDDDDPEDREGGATDDPRELLPEERGAALGREGAALGREPDEGLAAGRALLPDGRREEEGLTPLDGLVELPGLTASPVGLRDVPLGRTASREPVDRVTDVRVPASPLVDTVRVEIRPLASLLIAVRDAVRVVVPADRLVRPVLTSMRDREADRMPLVRLSMMMVPG